MISLHSSLAYGADSSNIIQSSNDSLKIEKINTAENEMIIDYAFNREGKLLILCKIKRSYFIKVFKDENDSQIFALNIKANKIVTDFEGRIYVLTKSEAIEIDIMSRIAVINNLPLSDFYGYIANIVTENPKFTLKSEVLNSNTKYSLKHNEQDSQLFIFEIIMKTIDGNNIVLRKIKKNTQGKLFTSEESIKYANIDKVQVSVLNSNNLKKYLFKRIK